MANKYSSNSTFVHAIQTTVRTYVGHITLSYDLDENNEDFISFCASALTDQNCS